MSREIDKNKDENQEKKEEPKDEKVDQKFEDLLSKFLKESNTKLDEARARYNQKTKKKNSRN